MNILVFNLIIIYSLNTKFIFSQCCKCKDNPPAQPNQPKVPCVCETNTHYCILKENNNLCVDLTEENMFKNNVAGGIKGGDCYQNGSIIEISQNDSYMGKYNIYSFTISYYLSYIKQAMVVRVSQRQNQVVHSLNCFTIQFDIPRRNNLIIHIISKGEYKARTKNSICLKTPSLDSLDKSIYGNAEQLVCCNINDCGKYPYPICFDPKEKGELCEDKFCKEQCQNGTYPDLIAQKCIQCHQSCTKCNGKEINQCTSCAPLKSFYKSECLDTCPPKTYKSKIQI